MKKKILYLMVLFVCLSTNAQMVPGAEENIPYLITFGGNGDPKNGDDDNKQAFYFIIPESFKNSIFVRIFDPEIGGVNDETIGQLNTKTKFTFYGGNGVYSSVKGINANIKSEKPSGQMLQQIEFGSDPNLDNKWHSLGPFNPSEGEYSAELKGYIFKILAEGITGDDGNIYKYFLSSDPKNNIKVSGANAFTFEYTVRLHESAAQVTHFYPFVDEKTVSLKQHNFDLDGVCEMSIYSIVKIGEKGSCSKNKSWAESLHKIENKERNSCIDFQVRNNKVSTSRNNNVVMYITNQYGEFLPFMSVPLGNYTPKRTILAK